MNLPAFDIPLPPLGFDIPLLAHPPVVHFAIVLPIFILILEIINLVMKRRALTVTTVIFYIILIGVFFATYATGKTDGSEAYDLLTPDGQAELKEHKLLGTYLLLATAVLFFLKFFAVALKTWWMKLLYLLALVGFVGAVLQQGKDGGELTFKYGANNEQVLELSNTIDDLKDEIDEMKEEMGQSDEESEAAMTEEKSDEAATEEKAAEPAKEATEPEAKKSEEPKSEEPKSEEPKSEEPKSEEPKAEEPKAEAAKPEESESEEPKSETAAPQQEQEPAEANTTQSGVEKAAEAVTENAKAAVENTKEAAKAAAESVKEAAKPVTDIIKNVTDAVKGESE